MAQLILTVTRACNLRCAYCPTVKSGWPELSPEQVRRALSLFTELYGEGQVKLFGGEPLLAPRAVEAALEWTAEEPRIRWLYLSSNGLGLSEAWLERVRRHPRMILTLSLDGRPEDHRRFRRALPGVEDAYEHIRALRGPLQALPRVVITQTIPPAGAQHALANFEHLLEEGWRRFNLLPGYFLPWREGQLAQLQAGLRGIGERIRSSWEGDDPIYLRNLFTWAPTPFFNSGMVVDADASIHPSNVGLAGSYDDLLEHTRLGTLDEPPTRGALDELSQAMPARIEAAAGPAIWRSTLAADALLSELCQSLMPHYLRSRQRRQRQLSPA